LRSNEKSRTPRKRRKRRWPQEILEEIVRLGKGHPNLDKGKLYPFLKVFCEGDNGCEFMRHFDAGLRRLHKDHWHTYPKISKMNAHVERGSIERSRKSLAITMKNFCSSRMNSTKN